MAPCYTSQQRVPSLVKNRPQSRLYGHKKRSRSADEDNSRVGVPRCLSGLIPGVVQCCAFGALTVATHILRQYKGTRKGDVRKKNVVLCRAPQMSVDSLAHKPCHKFAFITATRDQPFIATVDFDAKSRQQPVGISISPSTCKMCLVTDTRGCLMSRVLLHLFL